MSANQTIALAFKSLCQSEGEVATPSEMYNAFIPEPEAAEWLHRIASEGLHLGVVELNGERHPALFQ